MSDGKKKKKNQTAPKYFQKAYINLQKTYKYNTY